MTQPSQLGLKPGPVHRTLGRDRIEGRQRVGTAAPLRICHHRSPLIALPGGSTVCERSELLAGRALCGSRRSECLGVPGLIAPAGPALGCSRQSSDCPRFRAIVLPTFSPKMQPADGVSRAIRAQTSGPLSGAAPPSPPAARALPLSRARGPRSAPLLSEGRRQTCPPSSACSCAAPGLPYRVGARRPGPTHRRSRCAPAVASSPTPQRESGANRFS